MDLSTQGTCIGIALKSLTTINSYFVILSKNVERFDGPKFKLSDYYDT